jgi:hypothetical protein
LVGDIDKSSIVYILKGENEALVKAAGDAAEEAVSKQDSLHNIFVIDCISRTLVLENDFEKELAFIAEHIPDDDITMLGVLSVGEIANVNEGYIDFYNKTCVIGAF